MDMSDLLFVTWNVDRAMFHIGNFELRWYSVLFVAGFVLGWYIFKWFFKKEGIKQELLDSLLYTLLIGTIVGARLGHCLFYQPDYYLGSWKGFWEIFMPWKGGLASHGGTIALIIAMWWYARHYGRKNDFDFMWIMDHLAIATAFAAFFIRLGNLFNSEIFGHVTDLPWGFCFPLSVEGLQEMSQYGHCLPHHPTQLYEGLTYLFLGISLILLYRFCRQKMYRGTTVGIFFIVVFGSRFLIEFVKNDQVEFEQNMVLNMGQWLSLPFVLLGIGFLIWAFWKKQPFMAVHPEKKAAEPTHYAKSLR